jgi:hypothetical protein
MFSFLRSLHIAFQSGYLFTFPPAEYKGSLSPISLPIFVGGGILDDRSSNRSEVES